MYPIGYLILYNHIYVVVYLLYIIYCTIVIAQRDGFCQIRSWISLQLKLLIKSVKISKSADSPIVTYLFTYLLTYLLQGAESFLRR